jgi:ABC-type branched-subunit amino acid transport system substrate-binding protein
MKSMTKQLHRRKTILACAGVAMALSLTVVGCTSGSPGTNASGAAKGDLIVGELFPFTGAKALLSSWGTHGVDTGIYEVNQAGGVMGQKLKSVSADDAADSVDALPALRKLLLNNPVEVVGPFSPTIMSVINNFGPSKVVDFMIGGSTQLDNMNFPYVFRTTSSDSNESVAMAYYAAKIKGYKTASLIFDNSANSQGFVAPLMKAFKALGGTIQQNLTIVPGQGSYRSELTKAFADHPDVIFDSMDLQTASTLWANAQQLGYLKTPWIGDDLQSSADYAKAFGATAPTNLTAALAAAPTGTGYNHFLADYKAVFKTDKPLPTTFNEYDAIVIGALAMTEAKSTDPAVWVKHIADVASPPGTACDNYANCLKLVNAGKKINYEGAGGNNDFNKNHNVFSGFSMVGFNADLTTMEQKYVTPEDIASSIG